MTIRGLRESFERYNNCITVWVLLVTNHCESPVCEGWLHNTDSFLLAVNKCCVVLTYTRQNAETLRGNLVSFCSQNFVLMEHASLNSECFKWFFFTKLFPLIENVICCFDGCRKWPWNLIYQFIENRGACRIFGLKQDTAVKKGQGRAYYDACSVATLIRAVTVKRLRLAIHIRILMKETVIV